MSKSKSLCRDAGIIGLLYASVGIVYSFFGFCQAIQLAGETARPSRSVPIAVIGTDAVDGYGRISFGVAMGIAPFSLAILWLALKTALPADEVADVSARIREMQDPGEKASV